jgi:Reverse transcriptase (RNA-dependent DNA polymerase)
MQEGNRAAVNEEAKPRSNNPASYRPISNLSFFSKVIEKIVDVRLSEHVCHHRLLPAVQSAYHPYHSTEKGIVRVLNDMIGVLDQGHVGVLVLLDLSGAFDTVATPFCWTSSVDGSEPVTSCCTGYPISCPKESRLSGSIRWTLMTSLCCAAFRKDLYSVRSGLLSMPRMFRPVSSSIDYATTCTRMICRVSNMVNQPRLMRLCPALSPALTTSTAGVRRSAFSSTPAKRKCRGSVLLHSFAKYLSCDRTIRVGGSAVEPVSVVCDLGVYVNTELTMAEACVSHSASVLFSHPSTTNSPPGARSSVTA